MLISANDLDIELDAIRHTLEDIDRLIHVIYPNAVKRVIAAGFGLYRITYGTWLFGT